MKWEPSAANGKWTGILKHYGLTEHQLNGKHQACPCCGGKDRWRFDDTDGNGRSICAQCGSTDGIGLAMKITGAKFSELVDEIMQMVGSIETRQKKDAMEEAGKINRIKSIWKSSVRVTTGDCVWQYLSKRHVLPGVIPSCIRFVEAMDYYEYGVKVGNYSAMLALVSDSAGKPKTLHCTYLKAGEKADVEAPKKVLSKIGNNSAIRLYEPEDVLCVAEGIETALAVRKRTGKPVWSLINAGQLKTFECPTWIKRLEIWADNDANFTGQLSAYALANRMALNGIDVDVFVPADKGTDYAD